MLGDNMSVVLNTTIPSSQLKKKHNAIAYHRVREAIAAKFIKFSHIRSTHNVADCLTKPLTAEQYRQLTMPILFQKIDFTEVAPTGELEHGKPTG